MMKALPFLLLFGTSCCWAAPKPDPSQYTITVHVSGTLTIEFENTMQQQIEATIDGKKYVLHGGSGDIWVLKTGDYHARAVKDETRNGVEYMRSYEFLFPDGETRRYDVMGEEE
jgi:hypothetical protein